MVERMELKQSKVLNLERVQALETWLKTTNTKLIQTNGQRKYGGPPEVWNGPTPGSHCEVFISHIPRDAYEDLLIPLFSSVGPLWEFRLMMNFSGQNRGFGYAKYISASVATDAIRLLHGHTLEPGCHLNVCRSIEKRHLCIGGLPNTTRREDLQQVLRFMTNGVDRVSLKTGPGIVGVSAIVAFSSHHAASMAKKILVEAFKKQFAMNISITWQSMMSPSLDEQATPQNSKSLVVSLWKPPRLVRNSPQPMARPPRLASSWQPPNSRGFCRAVGGPAASPQGHLASISYPVMFLHEVCEATGVGQPSYEIFYSHTGPDGFLYFTYEVRIPRIMAPFKGLVTILPGDTTTVTLEEAQRAVAQSVLQEICSQQLDP